MYRCVAAGAGGALPARAVRDMDAIVIRTASIPSTHHLRLAIVVPLSVYRVPTAQLYGACSCRHSAPLAVVGVPERMSLRQGVERAGLTHLHASQDLEEVVGVPDSLLPFAFDSHVVRLLDVPFNRPDARATTHTLRLSSVTVTNEGAQDVRLTVDVLDQPRTRIRPGVLAPDEGILDLPK